MILQWTASARRDLVRLHDFLAPSDSQVAVRTVRQILAGVGKLPAYPQLGTPLEEFLPRHVRRIIVGDYEIRYELSETAITILRLWHCREDR